MSDENYFKMHFNPPCLNLECLERDLPLQFSKLNCQKRESAARSLNLSVPSHAGLPVLHTSAFVKFKFHRDNNLKICGGGGCMRWFHVLHQSKTRHHLRRKYNNNNVGGTVMKVSASKHHNLLNGSRDSQQMNVVSMWIIVEY